MAGVIIFETMETERDHNSDRELILKCQAGDGEAFAVLTRRYYQQAFAMAFYRVNNREAALDISQDAFVRIYRNIERFQPEKPFPAWLYTIVRNLCANYLQRQRKRWLVFSDYFSGGENAENSLLFQSAGDDDAGESRRQLWEAVNRLRENDREIIILKDLEGLSYREISEMLEIPEGSVMSRLYYARQRLAKLVKAGGVI